MATRRYRVTPQTAYLEVIEEAGAPVASDVIEATIELAEVVGGESGNKTISKEQTILALMKIRDWKLRKIRFYFKKTGIYFYKKTATAC